MVMVAAAEELPVLIHFLSSRHRHRHLWPCIPKIVNSTHDYNNKGATLDYLGCRDAFRTCVRRTVPDTHSFLIRMFFGTRTRSEFTLNCNLTALTGHSIELVPRRCRQYTLQGSFATTKRPRPNGSPWLH